MHRFNTSGATQVQHIRFNTGSTQQVQHRFNTSGAQVQHIRPRVLKARSCLSTPFESIPRDTLYFPSKPSPIGFKIHPTCNPPYVAVERSKKAGNDAFKAEVGCGGAVQARPRLLKAPCFQNFQPNEVKNRFQLEPGVMSLRP